MSRVRWAREKVGFVSDDFLDGSKSLNEVAVQVPFFNDWDVRDSTGKLRIKGVTAHHHRVSSRAEDAYVQDHA